MFLGKVGNSHGRKLISRECLVGLIPNPTTPQNLWTVSNIFIFWVNTFWVHVAVSVNENKVQPDDSDSNLGFISRTFISRFGFFRALEGRSTWRCSQSKAVLYFSPSLCILNTVVHGDNAISKSSKAIHLTNTFPACVDRVSNGLVNNWITHH